MTIKPIKNMSVNLISASILSLVYCLPSLAADQQETNDQLVSANSLITLQDSQEHSDEEQRKRSILTRANEIIGSNHFDVSNYSDQDLFHTSIICKDNDYALSLVQRNPDLLEVDVNFNSLEIAADYGNMKMFGFLFSKNLGPINSSDLGETVKTLAKNLSTNSLSPEDIKEMVSLYMTSSIFRNNVKSYKSHDSSYGFRGTLSGEEALEKINNKTAFSRLLTDLEMIHLDLHLDLKDPYASSRLEKINPDILKECLMYTPIQKDLYTNLISKIDNTLEHNITSKLTDIKKHLLANYLMKMREEPTLCETLPFTDYYNEELNLRLKPYNDVKRVINNHQISNLKNLAMNTLAIYLDKFDITNSTLENIEHFIGIAEQFLPRSSPYSDLTIGQAFTSSVPGETLSSWSEINPGSRFNASSPESVYNHIILKLQGQLPRE